MELNQAPPVPIHPPGAAWSQTGPPAVLEAAPGVPHGGLGPSAPGCGWPGAKHQHEARPEEAPGTTCGHGRGHTGSLPLWDQRGHEDVWKPCSSRGTVCRRCLGSLCSGSRGPGTAGSRPWVQAAACWCCARRRGWVGLGWVGLGQPLRIPTGPLPRPASPGLGHAEPPRACLRSRSSCCCLPRPQRAAAQGQG